MHSLQYTRHQFVQEFSKAPLSAIQNLRSVFFTESRQSFQQLQQDPSHQRRLEELLKFTIEQSHILEQEQKRKYQKPKKKVEANRIEKIFKQNKSELSEASSSQSQLDWRDLIDQIQYADNQLNQQQILTDSYRRFHNYLRISLTEKCNLRCQYCMPKEGIQLTPNDELLTTKEILRLSKIFAGAGVDKIRLTGGEPTVRKDIVEITQSLKEMPGVQTIAMTTNGLALRRKLAPLKAAGLSALNISLDTLHPAKFQFLTRRAGHERVLDTIYQAVKLGFAPLKLNVVIMRGTNEDEVVEFVELTRHLPINVRFIEYMPFDGNTWSHSKLVPYMELKTTIEEHFGMSLRRKVDPKGEVAKNFELPGALGSVSFITSMTQKFCSDCNRLRLLADGNLKVCLFGANEVSLRDAIRDGASDHQLRVIIGAAVQRKRAAHAGMFEIANTKNRSMITIGG